MYKYLSWRLWEWNLVFSWKWFRRIKKYQSWLTLHENSKRNRYSGRMHEGFWCFKASKCVFASWGVWKAKHRSFKHGNKIKYFIYLIVVSANKFLWYDQYVICYSFLPKLYLQHETAVEKSLPRKTSKKTKQSKVSEIGIILIRLSLSLEDFLREFLSL